MVNSIAGSVVRRGFTMMVSVALASALFQGANLPAASILGTQKYAEAANTSIGVSPGTNVATASSISGITFVVNGGTADYSSIPSGTQIGTSFTLTSTSLGTAFAFSAANYGTFMGTLTSENVFTGTGASFANFTFTGTFTPTDMPTGLFPAGLTGNSATLGLTFVQSDVTDAASITETASLTTPAIVPEPSSIALLGIGISGFIAFRRRFNKKSSVA
jgi:hypothetical protein